MKKPDHLQILLYLILCAMAFEVVVLARQNKLLKAQVNAQVAQQNQGKEEIAEGMEVPNLSLQALDGAPFELTYGQPGQKTLLYFFSLTCPQCMRNIPQWRQLTQSLADEANVRVVGIAQGDGAAIKEYAEGYDLNYGVKVASPADTLLAKAYRVRYVPTTMLIDDSSRVAFSAVGVLSEDKRQEFLNKIFSNTPLK